MAISDKITSMTNHLTADYDAIESVVGEVTVDKNIENITPLINNLYEELPKVTASGTALAINDTRTGKMKVQLMGNTSQTQKTGKNLLSLPFNSSSQFGITVTKNSDGTLKVNGTATADAAVIFNTAVTLPTGTYTLSGCPSGGGVNTYNLNLDQLSTMRDNGSGVTFTLNSERTSTAYVSVKSGVTMNNVIFKPMIVSGSTSGDFEPYTGKKATPNPDNPEQIHTCSGDNEVVVCGKNLFDKDNANYLSAYIDTNTIVSYSTYRTIYIKCKANTSYTIQRSVGTSQVYMAYTKTLPTLGGSCYGKITGTTITTGNDAEYLLAQVYRSNADTNTWEEIINSIMINVGSTALPYEPYQSSTYPINLGTYELCKIGTYQDKFIRNSGKNLISSLDRLYNTIYFNGVSTATDHIFEAGTYTFSYQSSKTIYLYIQKDGEEGTSTSLGSNKTITFTSNVKFNIWLYASGLVEEDVIQPMLNEGETALPYEPYGNGDLYLEKHIGKVVLDESEEGWSTTTSDTIKVPNTISSLIKRPINQDTLPYVYCSHLTTVTWNANWNNLTSFIAQATQNDDMRIRVSNPNMSLADFKTWLANNLPKLYFVLNTPTYTKIEGTLKDELEDVWRAYSYNGQTNVSQSNNDLPFELDASALKEWQ